MNLMSMEELDQASKSQDGTAIERTMFQRELNRREQCLFVNSYIHARIGQKNISSSNEFCNADYAPL